MSEDTFQAATMRKLRELERENNRLRLEIARLDAERVKLDAERMKREAAAESDDFHLYRAWQKQQRRPFTNMKWTQS